MAQVPVARSTNLAAMIKRPAACAAARRECPKCGKAADYRGRLHDPNGEACRKHQNRLARGGVLARDCTEYGRKQRQEHRGADVYETCEEGQEVKKSTLAQTRLSKEAQSYTMTPSPKKQRLGTYVPGDDFMTYDRKIINEVCSSYACFLKLIDKDSVVLDLGANIGVTSIESALRGAKLVKSFEPHPRNFKRLQNHLLLNRVSDRVVAKQSAVTNKRVKQVNLYCNEGSNNGTHTVLQTRGRRKIKVPNVHVSKTLSRVTMVKLDIEGGEYGMERFLAEAPTIDVVLAEFHFKKKHHKSCAKSFHKTMRKEFRVLMKPNLDNDKLWHTLALYKRKYT